MPAREACAGHVIMPSLARGMPAARGTRAGEPLQCVAWPSEWGGTESLVPSLKVTANGAAPAL